MHNLLIANAAATPWLLRECLLFIFVVMYWSSQSIYCVLSQGRQWLWLRRQCRLAWGCCQHRRKNSVNICTWQPECLSWGTWLQVTCGLFGCDVSNSVFFVNEDDDETFLWRTYFYFRRWDENCNNNASNFINVTKTPTKIGVFSSTRLWQQKLSEIRKLFRQVRNLPTSVFRKQAWVTKDPRFTWFEPCRFVYSIRCKVQMAANCRRSTKTMTEHFRWRTYFNFRWLDEKLWR